MPLRRAQEQGRHPHELLFLFLCVVGGVVGLIAVPDRPTALDSVLGGLAWVWFAALILSSAVALSAVFLRPPTCLFVERAAMYLQAPLFAVYAVAVVLAAGVNNAPMVIVWTVGGAVAAAIRARQITKAVKVAKSLPCEDLEQIAASRRVRRRWSW